MKLNIQYRLFLAFLAATATLVACMFFIMKTSFDRGFLRYVGDVEQQRLERLAEELENSYAVHGNWDFVRHNPAALARIMAAALPEENLAPRPYETPAPSALRQNRDLFSHPPRRMRRQLFHFVKRILLLDADRQPVFGRRGPPAGVKLRPLYRENRTIGYLGLVPPRQLVAPEALQFVQQQRRSFAIIALLMATAAALLSIPLARHLVKRIMTLAAATHRLAAGQYHTRVPAAASDELGQLARDFNSLAQTLEKNEQLRRQWVADISHELRTPLAVLRGEIEALQDGVRQQTPQTLSTLHGEVLHLTKLVDDLYQVSLADIGALDYRKEDLDLAELVSQAIETFRGEYADREIHLEFCSAPCPPLTVFADAKRLHQLLANLLENTLRYTDPGGRLQIRLEKDKGRAHIHFQDSAPGVPLANLKRLFDRLYRVDNSRSRASGGAGLGLTLCKKIVEAHDGTIEARPSPLGGLWLRIDLPLNG